MRVVLFVVTNSQMSAANAIANDGDGGGYCNWANCDGQVEDGDFGANWCNAGQDNCEAGCDGRWCTDTAGGLLPILSRSAVPIPPVRVLATRTCAALNGDTAETVPTTAARAAKMNRASIR